MTKWQPISTAPRNEDAPIIVRFDHEADPYQDPDNPGRLTDYAANAEGASCLLGKGIALAVWRDGHYASDGWESGDGYWVPGGWFAWLNGDAAEYAVNAILWQETPQPPEAGE